MPGRTGSRWSSPPGTKPRPSAACSTKCRRAVVDQVLVVVGGATRPDRGRWPRARGARVLVQQGPGYGAACWTGAEAALANGADIVAFLDGDYADPPADLPASPGAAQRRSRRPGARLPRPAPLSGRAAAHARLGNRLVLRADARAAGTPTSATCPRARPSAPTRCASSTMREMTYGWTVEMLAKAARAGLRIEQIDDRVPPAAGGRSKVARQPARLARRPRTSCSAAP